MPTPVRVGSSRPGAGRGLADATQSYSGTTSGYGTTRGESIGANARNPYAYMASQAAKAYTTSDKSDTNPKIKGAMK